jgi:hypothetical protein
LSAHAPDNPFSGLFPAGWLKLDLTFYFSGSISQTVLFFQLGCRSTTSCPFF